MHKLKAQGAPKWFMVAHHDCHGCVKKKNRDFAFDARLLFFSRCLMSEAPLGK